MSDDNQLRPRAETPDFPVDQTPDFPVERTELPEWRQVRSDEDPTRHLTSGAESAADTGQTADPGAGATGHPEESSHQTWQDTGTQAQPAPEPPAPQRIPAPTGPAWGTVAFGVVCLAVAAGALVLQVVDVTVDWRYVAPLAFAGVGALLVLVGLIGLTGRRRRE